jgi:CMP/dCMP kinase
MIITISGKPGSGKSYLAKMLASELNYKHYSTGDFMRQMADEKGISLLELSKQAEKTRKIDDELDKRQIKLGENKDNFVIDARLGFHFIPDSVKVFLDADIKKRAERILHDKIRKEDNFNLTKAIENIKIREKSEKKRYREYYNIEWDDPKNFDFILDTTNLTKEEVLDKVLEYINQKA